MTFARVLRARFSPRNKCRALDGELLIVEPKADLRMRSLIPHWFASLDGKRKSRFGWVAETQPFTIDGFVSEHVRPAIDGPELRAVLEILFRAASRLEPGLPMSCEYVSRGLEQRRMVLDVHRVFLPGPRSTASDDRGY